MGTHATHQMHSNSLAAYDPDKLDRRCKMICAAMERAKRPPTDREILRHLVKVGKLPHEDPNLVRPRITKLIAIGVFREVGERTCSVTGKTVRTTWPAHKEVGNG